MARMPLFEGFAVDYFRFYHSVVDNPKLHRLPPETYRVWTFLLCLASRRLDRGTLPPIEELSFELHMWPGRDDEVRQHVELLISSKLVIRGKGDSLRIADWEVYQPLEPKSTLRVRRHRQRARQAEETPAESPQAAEPHHETFQKRFSNVSETLLKQGETVFIEREKPPTESSASSTSFQSLNPPSSANPPHPLAGGGAVVADDDEDDEPFIPTPEPEPPPEVAEVERLADELFPSGGMSTAARRACMAGAKPSWVAEALRVARDAKASRWRYVQAILDRWQAAGMSDAERSAAKPRADPDDGMTPSQRRRMAKIREWDRIIEATEGRPDERPT